VWTFLAEGPDFPVHYEGCEPAIVDQTELRNERYQRRGIIDMNWRGEE
jgi:hypothetical protein